MEHLEHRESQTIQKHLTSHISLFDLPIHKLKTAWWPCSYCGGLRMTSSCALDKPYCVCFYICVPSSESCHVRHATTSVMLACNVWQHVHISQTSPSATATRLELMSWTDSHVSRKEPDPFTHVSVTVGDGCWFDVCGWPGRVGEGYSKSLRRDIWQRYSKKCVHCVQCDTHYQLHCGILDLKWHSGKIGTMHVYVGITCYLSLQL